LHLHQLDSSILECFMSRSQIGSVIYGLITVIPLQRIAHFYLFAGVGTMGMGAGAGALTGAGAVAGAGAATGDEAEMATSSL
jgi:hypothetical protein